MKDACLRHHEAAVRGARQPGHAVGARRRRARGAARPARQPRAALPRRRRARAPRTPRSRTGGCSSCSPRACARRARAGSRLRPARGAARGPADRGAALRSRTPASSPRTRCATSSARSRCSAFTSRCSTCARTPSSTARRSTRSSACSACRRATPSSRGEQIAVLAREIADRRPLIPLDISGFSAATREAVETFRTLYDLLRGDHPGTIDSYIISNTTARRICSRCCCS